MKTRTLFLSALMLLSGCATQQPVEIVDLGYRERNCCDELASLRQQCKADLDACLAARQAAESRDQERAAALQRLEQRLTDARDHAEQALARKDADLASCRSDLDAAQRQAKAEADQCLALREQVQKQTKTVDASAKQIQRLQELEDNLRQRLQNEIGAKDVEIERLRSQLSVRVLDRILFRSGSAEILPKGRQVLDAVAAALAGGDETIRIEGHADIVPIGPVLKRKYFSNWELSTGRASSVVRHFEDSHGIAPTRMEAVGFSKYRPVAPNDTEEGRQRNRRVEIVLTPWKPAAEECPPQ